MTRTDESREPTDETERSDGSRTSTDRSRMSADDTHESSDGSEESGRTDDDRSSNGRSSDDLPPAEVVAEARRDAPDWDDEYVDRVADRLVFNYDLERDVTTRGERFGLYGRMMIESQKHFFHPALSYANHGSAEHLFCRRTNRAAVTECERLVALGHDLANERIDADEEHYSTDFTFVLVTSAVPDDVQEFVSGFRDRTLLKYGYYGHYEINLVVAAPQEKEIVASREAHVEEAFRLWDPIKKEKPGLLDLIARRLQI